MSLPKWTDERTAQLTEFVGGESPVSQGTVAEAATDLETSTRSISSKLRKMGFDVELASAGAVRAFSDAQEDTLSAFVTDNSGEYTYAEIAGHFEDGHFSAKSIQGKILSSNVLLLAAQPHRRHVEFQLTKQPAEFQLTKQMMMIKTTTMAYQWLICSFYERIPS